MILGIIPARSGSKGIPHKNLATVAAQPLIAWTIQAALRSAVLDRVIVSTDSQAYAEVARVWQAEVPFLRPSDLAQDTTSGSAPIFHALEWFQNHESYQPEWVMVLQPTSPLRTAEDIRAAVQLAQDPGADAVVSISPCASHPYLMKQITPEGRLINFLDPPEALTQRQTLPAIYALNGAIYLIRSQILLQQQTFYPERTVAYVMPEARSLDIDTSWDLYLADLILRDQQARAGVTE